MKTDRGFAAQQCGKAEPGRALPEDGPSISRLRLASKWGA